MNQPGVTKGCYPWRLGAFFSQPGKALNGNPMFFNLFRGGKLFLWDTRFNGDLFHTAANVALASGE